MNDPKPTDASLLATLKALMQNPDMPVDPEWAEEMAVRYPCFIYPAVLRLQRDPDMSEEERRAIMGKVALRATDKDAFLAMTEATEAEMQHFYPAAPAVSTPSTNDAIDTFLDRYGNSSPEENALLERLIFNPPVEYAGLLEAQGEVPAAPVDEHDRMIAAFLSKNEAPDIAPEEPAEAAARTPEPETAPAEPHEEPASPSDTPKPGLFSESLARIFIKQHRYAKAYEILLNLSLNYPEKSIYFADQLRFLRKLIINQEQNQKEHI